MKKQDSKSKKYSGNLTQKGKKGENNKDGKRIQISAMKTAMKYR